jgi:diaminopimelate epimerase
MAVPFTKMHGAGNDFILLDDRNLTLPWHDHFLMAALATRRVGVGAEGIILVQPSDSADFRFLFLNPDGTEAALCGNGLRCAAAFAHEIGAAPADMRIETARGTVRAELVPAGVKIHMPDPTGRAYDKQVALPGRRVHGHFVNSGVPHFVVPVENTNDLDVAAEGPALRQHPDFAPEGSNIDFASFTAPNRISMRTYERGVEAESGACGTGAVACAVVGVECFDLCLPVRVRTFFGFDLTIDGDWRGKHCVGLTLTGPAQVGFRGTLDLAAFEHGATFE